MTRAISSACNPPDHLRRPTSRHTGTKLPALSVSSDFLDTAYQIVSATGSYTAAGTTSGQWMASIVALKTT